MTRLGWGKFARARAQLDAGLDREVVLTEANVDVDTWRQDEETLLGVLADDVERADFANIEAYRKTYQATWVELTHLTVVEPSSTTTSEGLQSPLLPSPDPAPLLQDAVPLPAWTKQLPVDHGGLDETMTVLDLSVRVENPLPFTAGASALPIAPAAAPPQEPVTSVSADPGTETMWAPLGFTARNPLPFQSAIDPAPPSDPPTPRRGAVTSTALLLAGTAQDAPSNSAPELTLEQYASLCAELAVFPQHVEAIFQRYGLVSLQSRLTVDLTWRERLRRDVARHHAWQSLYQRYQTYWADPTRRDGPP